MSKRARVLLFVLLFSLAVFSLVLVLDSETEFSRKLGLINFVVIMAGVVFFASLIDAAGITGAVLTVFAVVFFAVTGASLLFNRYAVKAGAKNLMEVEV